MRGDDVSPVRADVDLPGELCRCGRVRSGTRCACRPRGCARAAWWCPGPDWLRAQRGRGSRWRAGEVDLLRDRDAGQDPVAAGVDGCGPQGAGSELSPRRRPRPRRRPGRGTGAGPGRAAGGDVEQVAAQEVDCRSLSTGQAGASLALDVVALGAELDDGCVQSKGDDDRQRPGLQRRTTRRPAWAGQRAGSRTASGRFTSWRARRRGGTSGRPGRTRGVERCTDGSASRRWLRSGRARRGPRAAGPRPCRSRAGRRPGRAR